MAPEIDLVGVLRLAEVLKAGQVVLEKANAHNTLDITFRIGKQFPSANFRLTFLGKIVPALHVSLRRCWIATDLK